MEGTGGSASGRFVGRARELRALREELAHPRPSLVIVYGRRRVGKSRLILEVLRRTSTTGSSARGSMGTSVTSNSVHRGASAE